MLAARPAPGRADATLGFSGFRLGRVATRYTSQRHGITNVNFDHAGNGNIHVNLLVDPDNTEQMKQAQRCLREVFQLVLSLDGTLSGEHGVGLEKRHFMTLEFNQAQLDIMRRIKHQLDPKGLLNPGKLLPEN